MYIVIMLNTNS